MPIQTAAPVRVFDQDSFHRVDHRVTGLAFAIHNEFGRYMDERLYRNELTRRCRQQGLEVRPEFKITVRHADFSNDYYADHLIEGGVIVEAKTAAALAPAHRGQTLNYLFLCGLHHATLLNFGTERVQHEFVSTRLTHAGRRTFDLVTSSWKPLTEQCHQLPDLLRGLLTEWGAFLDPLLYRDAITHFLGGQPQVVRDISVTSDGTLIGTQAMHTLSPDVAFSVTASTHQPEAVCEHHHRFLRHTPLRAFQWINLNHHRIELRTIERQ